MAYSILFDPSQGNDPRTLEEYKNSGTKIRKIKYFNRFFNAFIFGLAFLGGWLLGLVTQIC